LKTKGGRKQVERKMERIEKRETEGFATLKVVGARIRQMELLVRILVLSVPSLFSCGKNIRRQKKGKERNKYARKGTGSELKTYLTPRSRVLEARLVMK
jgi:hypothetical protein